MPVTHTVTRQYKDQSSNSILLVEQPTGSAEINLDVVAPNANNTQYHIALTKANLQSLCIFAAVAMTLCTNNPSGSAPQDTIALTAGQTWVWTLATDGISKCPFSADVTSFYVTNTSGGAAPFKFRSVTNQ
jgi:hypothetical protein